MKKVKTKKKYKVSKKTLFKNNWNRRLFSLKGGLAASLSLLQPLFTNSAQFAGIYSLADLYLFRYCERANITPFFMRFLLAAIYYRDLTGSIYFRFRDLRPIIRSSGKINLRILCDKMLIYQVDAPPTPGPGRPLLVYCVSPLGLSIAADFNNCLLSLQEDIKTNKKVPEITAFINAYFDEQIRLYP